MNRKLPSINDATLETAGSLLAAARQNKALTVVEIVDALRLSKAQIAAIEADDWENLPEPVFVRGYLSSYARLVGADEARVLELYRDKEIGRDAKKINWIDQSANRPTNLGELWIRVLLVGLLIFAAVVGVIWWYGKQQTAIVYSDDSSVYDPNNALGRRYPGLQ